MSAILVFIALSSLISLALCLLFSHLTVAISLLALVLAGLAALWLEPREPQSPFSAASPDLAASPYSAASPWPLSFYLKLILLVGGSLQFIYLIYEFQGSAFVGNPNNIGDLPMHINSIKLFAKGLEFWPQNPEFSGQALRYPFGIDLFNSLFEVLGVPTRAHLVVLGLGLFYLTLQMLYRFGGEWLWVAFFFSGGYSSWQGLVQGTGWLPGSEIDWKNLFLAVFVTQRGFLFALPAGLWLIQTLEKARLSRKEQIQVGILWTSLAFFHLHSYLFLSLFLGGRLICQGKLKQQGVLVAAAFFLALPWTLPTLLGGEQLGHALGWSWGWTFEAQRFEGGFLIYFMKNFGSWVVIIPLLVWGLWRKPTAGAKKAEILWLLALTFFFFNFKVAPWAWDNIKVLLWAYLLLHYYFQREFLKSIPALWQLILAFALFYPGLIQFFSSYPATMRFAKFSAPYLMNNCQPPSIQVNDVVIARGDFDSPLLFQGTLLALGYEGHVWSHGYDLRSRKEQVLKVLAREENWQAAAQALHAKWVVRNPGLEFDFVKPPERAECGLILTPVGTTN